MNRDLIHVIECNIENLRFALDFDRFNFSISEQEAMVMHLDAISNIVKEVKRKESKR